MTMPKKQPAKETGAPAGAPTARHRAEREKVVNVRYADARRALSDWIDDHMERLGSGVMWDPETDEILAVSISNYRALPKRDLLASALQNGVTVHERLIDEVITEYESGGLPPTPQIVRFLAERRRGKGQRRPGAPRTQAQANIESETRDRVQTIRWYLIHHVGLGRDEAHGQAVARVAEEFNMDPRTVKKHST